MRGTSAVLAVIVAGSLACAGLEIPGMEPAAPPSPEVVELLDAERGEDPALEGEALTARTTSLEAFLGATPDFADWKVATLDCLAADCAPTTEDAYAKVKVDHAPKPPVVAAQVSEPWRVLVTVEHVYDAPEDWSDASTAVISELPAELVSTARAGMGEYTVSVTADGAEKAAIDLKPFAPEGEPKFGYVAAKAGAEALWIAHGPAPEVKTAACAYFEIECPAAEGEEGEEEGEEGAGGRGPGTRPPGAKAKMKAKMKAKAGG